MIKLYERILEHLINRLRGPWPDAIPLPPYVAALKLDPQLILLHLVKNTNGTGR